jgi:hypothetical protein
MDLQFGNKKLPSIINDPFKKTQITSIRIDFSKGCFDNSWTANGTIEFTNGDTTGKQSFKEKTFDEVVIKMKAMLDNLE